MDFPSAASLLINLINLVLGANVNTSGWLIEDQDFTVTGKPFCNNYLLLITTGKIYNQLICGRCFCCKLFDILLCDFFLFGLIDE